MLESNLLHKEEIINAEQLAAISEFEKSKPMSVHWELKTILYLGILLLTSGIGILIYLNIDTIGHQTILALILLSCGGCFYYAYKNRLPYSNEPVTFPSPLFDYIILLGCMLFAIFIGYLQYQYSPFGKHYGFATLIPTGLFFVCAYLFDHKGILSLAITGLAAWAGVTVTPLQLLNDNDFSSLTIVIAAIILGITLVGFSKLSYNRNIKKHFDFSYNNFAANILFVGTLAALFTFDLKFISFLFLALVCFYYIKYAITNQSFLFLLLSVIYGYIGLTYGFFNLLIHAANEASLMLGFFYIAASCAGVILFFIYYKRILGIKK